MAFSTGFLVIVIALLEHLAASEPAAGSAAPRIDPQVRNAVGRGSARVIVELRIQGGARPEGELADDRAIAAQRRAIADAQAALLSRLAGTHFSLIHRYQTIPFLALEIHADALAALETMADALVGVQEDTAERPSQGRRAPAGRAPGTQ